MMLREDSWMEMDCTRIPLGPETLLALLRREVDWGMEHTQMTLG